MRSLWHGAREAVRVWPTPDTLRDLAAARALRERPRFTVAPPVMQRHDHATLAARSFAQLDKRTTARIVNRRPSASDPHGAGSFRARLC